MPDAEDKWLAKIPGVRTLLGLVPPVLHLEPRQIYFNQDLPSELVENGIPKQRFASNKIRTTKYTAMTFVPRNFVLQMKSVANIFFVFVAIVSSFKIFGATAPGLGAVPIIAIIVITAIRDAIEDYRRFMLDREFNNEVTYVLLGFDNPNVTDEQVSRWRLFKKACSRAVTRIHRFVVHKPMPSYDLKSVKSARHSMQFDEHHHHNRASVLNPVHDTAVDSQAQAGLRLSYDLPRDADNKPNHHHHQQHHPHGVAHADDHAQIGGMPRASLQSSRHSRQHTARTSFHSIRRSMDIRSLVSRRKHIEPVRFKQQFWKNVQVGSIIKVHDNEPVPADMVILSSGEDDGSCFIETRNLDGETVLKPRIACPSTRTLRHGHQFTDAHFWTEIEGANSDLDRFGWALHNTATGEKDSLAPINFMPRGAFVRNSKFVIGFVVYTGVESKIILNAGETPTKRSRVAADLNFYVYISFAFIAVLCVISTIVQRIKFAEPTNSLYFFEFGMVAHPISLNAFVNFIASITMYQNIIPISLYISIEIVKTIQAWFIYSDNTMYDETTGERCTPKTWNIGDDLGQIEYIFSDKTGTLTQNSMVFRKCTVNGKSYGVAYTEASAGLTIRNGGNVEQEQEIMQEKIKQERREMEQEMEKYYNNPFSGNNELVSASIYRDIPHSTQLQQFATCMALCSTVVTEKLEDGKIIHKAESPDEAALVSTANELGYTLVESPKHWKYLNILGTLHKYQELQTLFFTSDRKRMSTVVRDESGRTFVYTKGADVIIRDRLAKGSHQLDADWDNLMTYANEGLRTLLVGFREIDSKWADEWCQRWTDSQTSPDREQLSAQLADEIEHDFHLLGGTGIEDQLQEQVPKTISMFARAGIKVWVLTGDKPETAISIGYSCQLLEPGMDVMRIEQPSDVIDMLAKFNLTGTDEEIATAAADHRPAPPGHGLVVDGIVLDQICEDESLIPKFALLGKQCKSVLCCRVSPSQKAKVVQIVKQTFDVTALSVGDGANDVPMIQMADVGIGIVGVEGRQASMSADYSIGKFMFLQRLVLVHGHWSYVRTCRTIGILLYKNIVFTMCLFWNGIFNQFDNSYMCDYSLIVLYNSVFTSIPVISTGLFDQDISATVMLNNPELYAKGILRTGWTKRKFVEWVCEGLYQSVVIYFFTWLNFWNGQFVNVHGIPSEYLTAMGVYIISASVLTVNTEVLLIAQRWDVITLVVELLSALVMLAFICIYTVLTTSRSFYGAYNQTYGTIPFWASTFLTLFICLAPKIVTNSVRTVFFPDEIDIAREKELEYNKHFKKQHTQEAVDPEKVEDPAASI